MAVPHRTKLAPTLTAYGNGSSESSERIARAQGLRGAVSTRFPCIYRRIEADHAASLGDPRSSRHISERPAVVEEESLVGDRVVDNVIGAENEAASLSATDILSKYLLLWTVEPKFRSSAQTIRSARCWHATGYTL